MGVLWVLWWFCGGLWWFGGVLWWFCGGFVVVLWGVNVVILWWFRGGFVGVVVVVLWVWLWWFCEVWYGGFVGWDCGGFIEFCSCVIECDGFLLMWFGVLWRFREWL